MSQAFSILVENLEALGHKDLRSLTRTHRGSSGLLGFQIRMTEFAQKDRENGAGFRLSNAIGHEYGVIDLQIAARDVYSDILTQWGYEEHAPWPQMCHLILHG